MPDMRSAAGIAIRLWQALPGPLATSLLGLILTGSLIHLAYQERGASVIGGVIATHVLGLPPAFSAPGDIREAVVDPPTRRISLVSSTGDALTLRERFGDSACVTTATVLVTRQGWLAPTRERRKTMIAVPYAGNAAAPFLAQARMIFLEHLVNLRVVDAATARALRTQDEHHRTTTLWRGHAYNAGVLGLLVLLVQSLRWRTWWRGRRLRRGLCPECGYPLPGLPQPQCPECGTVLAHRSCRHTASKPA